MDHINCGIRWRCHKQSHGEFQPRRIAVGQPAFDESGQVSVRQQHLALPAYWRDAVVEDRDTGKLNGPRGTHRRDDFIGQVRSAGAVRDNLWTPFDLFIQAVP